VQDKPRGLADAFIGGKEFIEKDKQDYIFMTMK